MTKSSRRRDTRLNPVERIDTALADAVALDGRTIAGKRVARFAELGDQPPLQILSGATIAAGAIARDRKLLRAGLRMLTAHGIATLAKAFVKDNVDRTRPGEAEGEREAQVRPGNSQASRLQSFPSGHSAGVVAVASAAVADYPALAVPALLGSAALVGAQLPSRNHYLSDVVVGGAIGLVAFGPARLMLPPLRR